MKNPLTQIPKDNVEKVDFKRRLIVGICQIVPLKVMRVCNTYNFRRKIEVY